MQAAMRVYMINTLEFFVNFEVSSIAFISFVNVVNADDEVKSKLSLEKSHANVNDSTMNNFIRSVNKISDEDSIMLHTYLVQTISRLMMKSISRIESKLLCMIILSSWKSDFCSSCSRASCILLESISSKIRLSILSILVRNSMSRYLLDIFDVCRHLSKHSHWHSCWSLMKNIVSQTQIWRILTQLRSLFESLLCRIDISWACVSCYRKRKKMWWARDWLCMTRRIYELWLTESFQSSQEKTQ